MNIINGVAVDTVSVRDRGFAYGDGAFRTLLLRGGKPVLWPRQYTKLAQDCAALKIECPPRPTLESDLGLIDMPECVVKIIVTRGVSARGYAPPETAAPTRAVLAGPLPDHRVTHSTQGVRVHLCRLRLAAQPAYAGVKHLNRLENVLARSEWSDSTISEGLLCDAADNVLGGTMTNLFIVKDGALATPELTGCGVAGVTRDVIMERARSDAVPLQVRTITLDDLLRADEIFAVNSVVGLWPIVALGHKAWRVGKMALQAQRWIADAQSI